MRGLCRNYEAQVTHLFTGYINSLLQQHSADPRNGWKAKDAAIFIVIALTVRGGNAKLGATQTNQAVNLLDFFGTHVLPELQAAAAALTGGGASAHPVLIADALKFVTVFRSQLPADAYSQALPAVVTLLGHTQTVVHT